MGQSAGMVGLGDPIAESLVVMPPLGLGINVLNSSQFALEVSSSSNGKEYKALPQKGKGSGCNRGHSSCRGARGRGRRRAIILSSHGMRTRKSTQRPFTISVGGPEWEFDDEFTKVIEELVVRGVNLTEPNPCYGEDGGWRVEEEVAKVLETSVA
ncbi:hypothetical protein Q3G72_019450 [Acer saccharum]|nr:hypothetical protein Q3G72_019450 [Acer saccharum]